MRRVSCSLVTGGLLLALLAGCSSTGPDSTASAETPPAQRRFGILRTPSEGLPGSERRRILESIPLNGPQTLTDPQSAITGEGRLWVFLIGQHVLCVAQSRGEACAPLKDASRRGVFLGIFRPPTDRHPVLHGFLVQGAVPNHVKHVVVTVGKRRTRVVPVNGNVISVEAERPVHVKQLLEH